MARSVPEEFETDQRRHWLSALGGGKHRRYFFGNRKLNRDRPKFISRRQIEKELVAMTKSELISRIAELNPHLFQRDVERIVSTIFEEVAAALARGDRDWSF